MYSVRLQPSGHSFEIEPGARILSSALKAGYSIRYSCRQGMCGMCVGVVKDGCVDHGKNPPPAGADSCGGAGPAYLCQATAKTDIVIEVEELEVLYGPRRMPCKVANLQKLGDDIVVLQVRVPLNERFTFAPGQYVELQLNGVRRNFSIANACEDIGSLVLDFHIRRRPGGLFTSPLFTTLKQRDLLKLEGPLGAFFLQEGDGPLLFCATGTGFAPVKSMIETALRDGVHLKRPIHLYWGGRTRSDLYMSDLVEQWAATVPGFTYHAVISRPEADEDKARHGYIQDAVREDLPDLSSFQVYACGGSDMIAAARSLFIGELGLPAAAFYADEFLPASEDADSIPSVN